MINTYANNNGEQLSTHFNVREFKCKCGATHSTLIDTALIDKLEKLYSKMNCSKIIISSGYRCINHDKAVGGNGYGQHTKGTAADVICYDKDDKVISAKKIACAAQDLGFGGIGNITASYNYIHLDVRTSNIWKGDEAVKGGTSASVTSDYYNYYTLSKADVYGSDTEKTKREINAILEIEGKKYSGLLTEID